MSTHGMRWWRSSATIGLSGSAAVMPMIRALMNARSAEICSPPLGGERRLTDILHLSELLQEAATGLESEHARYLLQPNSRADTNASSQQMRLEMTNTVQRLSPFTSRKGWNIRWSGCRLSPVSVKRSRRSITIGNPSRRCWILTKAMKAPSWRRPSVWQKTCAALRRPNPCRVAL